MLPGWRPDNHTDAIDADDRALSAPTIIHRSRVRSLIGITEMPGGLLPASSAGVCSSGSPAYRAGAAHGR